MVDEHRGGVDEKRVVDSSLKVAEAIQDDVNKGIVRVDSSFLKDLGVHSGDIVEIEGARKSVGIVDRAYPGDIGLNIIRMDGLMRRNVKTSIGEFVKVRKAVVKEAKRVTIAPARSDVVVTWRGPQQLLRQNLLGRALVKGDVVSLGGTRRRRTALSGSPLFEEVFSMLADEGFNGGLPGFGDLKFIVVDALPKGAVIITDASEIVLNSEPVEVKEESVPDVTYEDIGGLGDEIRKIREMVELPLKHPEIFGRLGIEPPKGVLLHGPPGTGKTLLAKAVANETSAHFISVNGPEIVSKFYGASEENLRKKFDEAEKNAPAIIFFDEIDAIASKREDARGEVERRIVAQLLTLMDGLKSRGKVVVIAATNMPNSLDPALRRPGRFDREVEISAPNKEGRLTILKIHTRNMPFGKDVVLKDIASVTHGFVGADLASLAKEAAMIVLRRVIPDLRKYEETDQVPQEILDKLQVHQKDFVEALKVVRPSAMREVLVDIPSVKWSDIGGLEIVKQQLKESVEWPLKHPEAFKRLGIHSPRGVLLYGAPGTGKTLLAKAVATECESNFISVKGPSLLSMWVGESERGVRKIFEKARQTSPAIIFFDEIDALAPRRGASSGDSHVTERVVNQLLTEMDGLESLNDVVVIGATNRPDMVDTALLRPGRFDRIILTPVPDSSARFSVLKIHTKGMPLSKDVNLQKIADECEGFVGADIEALCRESAMISLRENMNSKEVSMKDFDNALKVVRPSVTKEIEDAYASLENRFKGARAEEMKKDLPNYFG